VLSCADMTGDEQKWLDCATRMAAAGKAAAQGLYGTASGRVVLGRGAGGDRTLEVDRACEAAILGVLEREAPAPYSLVSEEAGIGGPSDAPWRVVVDPLDGSLNAKRGLEPFAASIAVADGGALGDVRIGYVEDYTRPRVFSAVRGEGLLAPAPREGADAASLPSPAAESVDVAGSAEARSCRYGGDLVEIVLFEAGRPDRHHFRYGDLSTIGAVGCSRDMRLRQIGSLALSLCYVATGVADLLVAAVRSRSVDLAAGLLILREAGGRAVTLAGLDILQQPLDLEKRSPFVAWRAGLDEEELLFRTRQLRRDLL
jgi:myo-inositol-1(or 4)-monophosphatase